MMWELFLTCVVAPVIGFVFAVAWRHLRRRRFWKRIEDVARKFLADPSVPIEDPHEAAEAALLEAQRAQLDAIERSLRSGGNGFNGH